ncbi:MAG: beta-CASP ribonuclease aCPSF1 [Nitrososphaeria archaeon]
MQYKNSEKASATIFLQNIPPEAQVTTIEYEGPRFAIYTKNPRFFIENSFIISDIVSSLKKRIVIRADKSIRKSEEETKEIILQKLPKDVSVDRFIFDKVLGEVFIELKDIHKIYSTIGEQNQEIFSLTGWRPKFRKTSSIKSEGLEQVYYALQSDWSNRERILKEVGEYIFRPKIYDKIEVVVSFLGGFQEVGRSCVYVKTNESNILIDCGINPGAKNSIEAYPRLDMYLKNLEELDAVIISHAHLDHCGFLPVLFKYGYEGPVYCSEPTLYLMSLLLSDFIKVSSSESATQLFDTKDLREMIQHCIPLPYGSVTDISPDTKLILNNAGHILGSASVHLHFGEGVYNLVYTGDFKFEKTQLLEAAQYGFPRVETLIVESTYGSKEDIMPPREEVEKYFVNAINHTLSKGGKVLIPVPAVGRAQEIMLVLDRYLRAKEIVECPVFIEGMITDATAIHFTFPDYLSSELRSSIIEQGINPFESEYFTIINKPDEREEVLQQGPAIIMATSGMLEGGASIKYLEALAGDERNKVLFVSYQISGTLGRRVLDGAKQISIIDDEGKIKIIDLKCEVDQVVGFSGHSDYNQIMKFISKLRPKLKNVIVNHGEKNKTISISNSIKKLFHIPSEAPSCLDAMRLV